MEWPKLVKQANTRSPVLTKRVSNLVWNIKNFLLLIVQAAYKQVTFKLRKTELNVKYVNISVKRYQPKHRNKLDSLEKYEVTLKKIRWKSQRE